MNPNGRMAPIVSWRPKPPPGPTARHIVSMDRGGLVDRLRG